MEPRQRDLRRLLRRDDVDELRDNLDVARIITASERPSRACAQGEMLNLSPLCGGVPPEIAWPYLKRVGEVVMPEAPSDDRRRPT